MNYNVVVAHSFPDFGIGINNALPWTLTNDLKHFKSITTSISDDYLNDLKIKYINVVIMGRKTWDSIPQRFSPLPNRLNIIITNNTKLYELNDNMFIRYSNFDNLETVISDFNKKYYLNEGKIIQTYKNFIIGGEIIYKLAFEKLNINKIYTTEVYYKFDYDTFFPKFDIVKNKTELQFKEEKKFILLKSSKLYDEHNIHYRFLEYQKISFYLDKYKTLSKQTVENHFYYENSEESDYLKIMKKILDEGIKRGDRTGTGTLSLFGQQMKFDLRHTFPISTTKRIFLRGIFEELMLYLRGQTDNKILNDKNIHIWDGNTSTDFLEKRGLNEYKEGDMGETYGFNFRHFGGDYKGCQNEYGSDNGFDQLEYVINLIKNEPESRRIIINLWNPKTLYKAALPSCLCQYQFYVNTATKELNLQIYIRSTDYFLANNWNTCTGALFVHLLCSLNGIDLTPGELTVVTGDTHIYINHLDQVNNNLDRLTQPFPKCIIKEQRDDITKFEFEDILLIGYKPQPRISAPLAI
jgi:dihydrofolate reductase/thymidylate synthase